MYFDDKMNDGRKLVWEVVYESLSGWRKVRVLIPIEDRDRVLSELPDGQRITLKTLIKMGVDIREVREIWDAS